MGETHDDLRAAFKLIYKEYHKRKYCESNEAGMHYSPYCLLPQTRTFMLKNQKQLLGTMTLIGDSPWGLPTESLFPEEIAKH